MRREEFSGFESLSSNVADKAWKYIEAEDFDEAVDKTWNLFFIEAKKFLHAPDDHEKGFSVRLVDNLSQELKLNQQRVTTLHKLRKLRNKIVKQGHESKDKDWSVIRTAIEVLDLVLNTKKPVLVDGATVCPDCGAFWDDYDECDWCGWSGKPAQQIELGKEDSAIESPTEAITHEGRTNCEECGEKWEEGFEMCDWCGWPHLDED
jgi:hypothetical protein